ncbi:transposase [Streptomyces viridosporus]
MKNYPPQFKADVVAPYQSRPEATIRQVAADPGINPETLRNRVRAAGASRPRGRRAETPAEPPTRLGAENAALRKKVRGWRRNARSCGRRPRPPGLFVTVGTARDAETLVPSTTRTSTRRRTRSRLSHVGVVRRSAPERRRTARWLDLGAPPTTTSGSRQPAGGFGRRTDRPDGRTRLDG